MTRFVRTASLLAVTFALGACSEGLDLDLRGGIGGSVDTSQAALGAIGARPAPDPRGVISYPSYQVAVARRGDTVAQVAQRVGLPPQDLARYNGLSPSDGLRRGEIIALPRRVEEPPSGTEAAQVDVTTLAAAAIDRAADTTPRGTRGGTGQIDGVEPVRHLVARGETAFTIARLYNVSPRSLAEWNALDRDFTIREGQYLLVPVAAEIPRVAGTDVPEPGSGSPTPLPPSSSQPLPELDSVPDAPDVTAGPITATPEVRPAEPVVDIGQEDAQSSGGSMAMPVQGSIIREFSQDRTKGITIGAAPGAPVVSSMAGTVFVVGKDTSGIEYIVIRHADNINTAYLNISDASVTKGDRVSRGQQIARVAPSDPGFVEFSVLNGTTYVDPMAYLQ